MARNQEECFSSTGVQWQMGGDLAGSVGDQGGKAGGLSVDAGDDDDYSIALGGHDLCISAKFDDIFDTNSIESIKEATNWEQKVRAEDVGSCSMENKQRFSYSLRDTFNRLKLKTAAARRQMHLDSPNGIQTGKPSTSTLSELLGSESNHRKVRLMARAEKRGVGSFYLPHHHSQYQHDQCRELAPVKDDPARDEHFILRTSFDSLRTMVERNLIAALIGVYMVISLTVIIVLISPYVFNLVEVAQRNETVRGGSGPGSGERAKTSVATQTDDFLAASVQRDGSYRPSLLGSDIKPPPDKEEFTATLTATKRLGDQSHNTSGGGGASSITRKVPKLSTQLGLTSGVPQSASTGFSKGAGTNQATGSQAVRPMKSITNQTSSSSANAGDKFHEMWNIAFNQPCQPLKIPACSRTIGSMLSSDGYIDARSAVRSSNLGAPYDKTLLPNQFTRTRQSQVERMISKFDPIFDIKCYPLMPLFLCTVYAPKCVPLNRSNSEIDLSQFRFSSPPSPVSASDSDKENGEDTSIGIIFTPKSRLTGKGLRTSSILLSNRANTDNWSRLVPPCRSLCREALRRCTFFFEVLSLRLISPEDCDQLPESSDPNVCVGQHENNLVLESAFQTCDDDKFRCSDGGCIPRKWRCDGYADCIDRSDELRCSKCNIDSEFYCGQDVCIDKTLVCNGLQDCRDGRDERQCLRLSNETAGPNNQRQLEVWSAVENKWVTVCGAHWSAMPMSHEACQALGYSRANTTLIMYGQSSAAPVGSAAQRSTTARIRSATYSNRTVDAPARGRMPGKGGGWFDITSGGTFHVNPEPENSNHDSELSANKNAVGIVEDVAAASMISGSGKHNHSRLDHTLLYERYGREGQAPSTNESLFAIDAAEVKLRSITSMLYHGPQLGCMNRAASEISSVYLQCQNFQCGRAVTSHSSRVRPASQVYVSGQVKYVKQKVGNIDRPISRSSGGIGLVMNESIYLRGKDSPREETDGTNQPDRHPRLEADEEFDFEPLDDDEDDNENGISLLTGRFIDGLSDESSAMINQSSTMSHEPAISSRWVVGGVESMPGEFPYLAALHGGPNEVFFCGGVLISINWLLTAAHCVGNRTQPDGWMVKVGVTRRIASPAFVRKLKVKKIIKHPHFNQGSLFNNDIALILLEESVDFNQYLRPICLPRANLRLGPDNSEDCVVVGFGKSMFSQEANYLHVAHFVNVPIVRHSTCSNWYSDHGVNLTDGMLCAGYAEGKRDACQGDSGSGLFCRYANTNQFFVAGVVSFGIKCATPKLPGVYTSVPLYVDWIESTTREYGYSLLV